MICETCGEEIEQMVCPFCRTVNAPKATNKKPKKIVKVNIKDDLPTVETALARLSQIVKNIDNNKVVKIVHGYGSTGKGGLIKDAVRKALEKEKMRGSIRGFIPGEEFSAAYDNTGKMFKIYPFIESDEDCRKSNPGITLILF